MKHKMIPYNFNPDFRAPSYLTRMRLLKCISKNTSFLKGKLLDFGCGSKPYRSLMNVDQYVGLDIADNPGHSHDGEDIDVFYDGKKIPFDNGYFDSVFSTEVFEHVFNLEEMLVEINRVMKIGGNILITCPFAICEHEVPNDFARYTSHALIYLFEKNGFELIVFDKAGNSIEVIFQLWISYFHLNIQPLLSKIPVVRSLVRISVCVIFNAIAMVLSKLLPEKNKLLYLNNVVLCRKIKSL